MRIKKGITTATVFVAPYGEIKVEDANAEFLFRMGHKNLVEDDNFDRKGKIKPVNGDIEREDVAGNAPNLDVRVSEGSEDAGRDKGKAKRPERKSGQV